MLTSILIVTGVIFTIGVILVIIGLRSPRVTDESELQARLEELSKRGEQIDLEKIELSRPFTERVIYPFARRLGEVAVRFTPQNALINIERKLEQAGTSQRIDPTLYLAAQFIMMFVFAGLIFLVFQIGQTKWPTGRILLVSMIFGLLGFFFPDLWMSSRIKRRQKGIRKAMPDALDLLTICVEAGLGFDAAMAKVSEKWQTELSLAFARVIKEVQLGKLRREALRDMADRIGISELTSFVAAVIQSEQLGVSLAKVLRIQSDQMRVRRRQLAEEEAHKAPVKMIIPMALLIFPALMIVLLAPAAIKLLHSMLGDMLQ
ncbi:MAG: type II secretion system F family protein [Anaerolineae bacterium]|nr:type II secretion system F family protein [Anaerolineae bacterium]